MLYIVRQYTKNDFIMYLVWKKHFTSVLYERYKNDFSQRNHHGHVITIFLSVDDFVNTMDKTVPLILNHNKEKAQ